MWTAAIITIIATTTRMDMDAATTVAVETAEAEAAVETEAFSMPPDVLQ